MSWNGWPVEGLSLLTDLQDQTQQLHDAMVERAYAIRMTSRSSLTPVTLPKSIPAEDTQRIP